MKYRWDPKFQPEISHIQITYIHRGGPSDEKTIKYEDIMEIEKRFILIQSVDGPTYIPMHRIKKIVNSRTDETIYTKSENPKADE